MLISFTRVVSMAWYMDRSRVVVEAWQTLHSNPESLSRSSTICNQISRTSLCTANLEVLLFNQSFEWSFRPNVLGTTLFFCGLGWRDAFGVFDMYRYKRDKKRGCKHYCYWEVAVDEIYGFNDDGINDIIFFWPKSPDRSLKHKPRSDIVSRYIRTK